MRAILLCCLVLASTAGPAEIRVEDDTGRQIQRATPAVRIVTLAPHATELVVAAGAADLLVAIANGGDDLDMPRRLPRIGGPGRLDRERLLTLNPDLVIGWQSGNRSADLDWIAASGITLLRSEPASLADVAATIEAIGSLSGRGETAQRAAAALLARATTPCAQLVAQDAYLALWDRPAMSIGGDHWINDVLARGGFRNVLRDLRRGAFQITAEARLAATDAVQIPLQPGRHQDQLAALLTRPGPRLAEAAVQLCDWRIGLSREGAATQGPGIPVANRIGRYLRSSLKG